MKKKEVLIIFLLAVLVTGGSWVWEEIIRREANSHGFPFKFYWFVMSGGVRGVAPIRLHYTSFIPQWSYTNLLLDFLFWFLVIFALWQVVKWIRRKFAKNMNLFKFLKTKISTLVAIGVILLTALLAGVIVWLGYARQTSISTLLEEITPITEQETPATTKHQETIPTAEEETFTDLITDDNFVRSNGFGGKAIEEYLADHGLFQGIREEPLHIQGYSYQLFEAINLVSIGSKRSHEINPRVVIALMKLKERRDGLDSIDGDWLVELGDSLYQSFIGRAFRDAATIHLASGETVDVPGHINTGTFAIYSVLAKEAVSFSDWKCLIGKDEGSFYYIYSRLPTK